MSALTVRVIWNSGDEKGRRDVQALSMMSGGVVERTSKSHGVEMLILAFLVVAFATSGLEWAYGFIIIYAIAVRQRSKPT